MPIGMRAGNIIEGMKDLAERARAAGKKPSDFPVSVFGTPADPETLKQYADTGVERALFWVPPDGRDKVLPLLDKYAAAAKTG
jgi:hypothetical protein